MNELNGVESNSEQGSGVVADARHECQFCHRKFNPDRVQKHMKICNKTHNKKRKKYDADAKRIEGTPFEEFKYRRSSTPPQILEWKKTGGRRWRQEVAEFRQIMGKKNDACFYVFFVFFVCDVCDVCMCLCAVSFCNLLLF